MELTVRFVHWDIVGPGRSKLIGTCGARFEVWVYIQSWLDVFLIICVFLMCIIYIALNQTYIYIHAHIYVLIHRYIYIYIHTYLGTMSCQWKFPHFFGDRFLLQLRYLLRLCVIEQWHSQRTMLHRNRFLQVYTLAWFFTRVESDFFWTGSPFLREKVISFQSSSLLQKRGSP